VSPGLLEHVLAPHELDALLTTLVRCLCDSKVDLLAHQLGIVLMAQLLEARCSPKVNLDDVGQIIIVVVEEPRRLAGDERQVLLDGGQRLDAGPVVHLLDEVAGAWIGDRVSQFGQHVLGIG
jgi:hypothetical protein